MIYLDNIREISLPNRYTKQKKTIVNGVEYPSATIAAKSLGFNKITLIKRIKSKNYPTYQYAGEIL
jgi:hypothetical protein